MVGDRRQRSGETAGRRPRARSAFSSSSARLAVVTNRNGNRACTIAASPPIAMRSTEQKGEAAMLRVGLAHRRRMGGKEIGHDIPFGRYRAAIKAIVVSSMRLENPHSLSYHEDTLTSLPETLVRVASNTEERASWLKSIETRGAVL